MLRKSKLVAALIVSVLMTQATAATIDGSKSTKGSSLESQLGHERGVNVASSGESIRIIDAVRGVGKGLEPSASEEAETLSSKQVQHWCNEAADAAVFRVATYADGKQLKPSCGDQDEHPTQTKGPPEANSASYQEQDPIGWTGTYVETAAEKEDQRLSNAQQQSNSNKNGDVIARR